MAVQIQIRRDLAASWTSNDPTLSEGEIGYETDTGKIKVGDGSTAWTSLDYIEAAINHDDLSNITGTISEYNHPTDANMTVLGNTSNTNTGDQTIDNEVTRSTGLAIVESDTAVTVADGKVGIPIDSTLNGFEIVDAQANVYTKGVTGATDVQIRRQRGAVEVDVLSTKITLGDEYFAVDGVVNTSNDDLVTGDTLFVDVDAIHSGTAPNGLSIVIKAQKP